MVERSLTFVLILPLFVAACDMSDPVSPEANNFTPATEVLPPTGSTDAESEAEAEAEAEDARAVSAATIPPGLRGRWGLTPADCTSERGDAKGLLVITADGLRFYESVARPLSNAIATRDSISGNFAFTGEGTSWTRYQSLELQGGKLIRTETDPTASHTYVACD